MTKWFDRKFDFTFQENIFPLIIERLRGTPARLEEKVKGFSENELTHKRLGSWSVKENIGHLVDLEPLWLGRLDDILKGEQFLRVTDLQNKKTDEAQHNLIPLARLLKAFRDIRTATVSRLTQLTAAEIYMSALHPRLKTPMRTMDHFLFVAEHDDHHLTKINELTSNNK